MLRDYLSAEAFKSGIVRYLQKYSYKNTRNEDLWNSMASVSMVSFISVLEMAKLITMLWFGFSLHPVNPSEKNPECFLENWE